MESLVRRYFWVVNLALLAIIAWFAGRVINNVIAERIVLLPTNPVATENTLAARAEAPNTRGWAQLIAERNLFNANPPEPEGPDAEGEEGKKEDDSDQLPSGMPPGPNDPCKASDAKLGLRATMVAEPSEWSMAVIAESATEERIARPGTKLGDLTLVAVHRERVVIAKGGAFECIELGQAIKGGPPVRAPAERAAPAGGGATKSKLIVNKTGENAYQIDRAGLDEVLNDLGALASQARVIPHYKDGKPEGFKVVGVRPASLYSQIGVRSGDVIKAVNDEEINSPNKALELFEKLKNSNNVTVSIERRGRPVNFDYTIK